MEIKREEENLFMKEMEITEEKKERTKKKKIGEGLWPHFSSF